MMLLQFNIGDILTYTDINNKVRRLVANGYDAYGPTFLDEQCNILHLDMFRMDYEKAKKKWPWAILDMDSKGRALIDPFRIPRDLRKE